jgi:hypothetical protein
MRKFLDWLYSHGVPMAYGFIISIALALTSLVLLGVVFFAKVLDKIR